MKYLKAHLVWGDNLPSPDLVDFRDVDSNDPSVKFNRKTLFRIPLDERLQELMLDALPQLNKNREIIETLLKDFPLKTFFFPKKKISVHFGIWNR